jgi:DNA-3-methyladenine glycosylase II
VTHINWPQATQQLAATDPVMRRILAGLGSERLRSRGEPFTCLARSIVGQQISVKAADSVWSRLCGLLTQPTDQPLVPQRVLAIGQGIREAGLSASKVAYLLDLAAWFESQPNLSHQFDAMTDQELIVMLTTRPGIGPWTAQMFLIFTLMRPDVFPADDLGVIKAIERLYAEQLEPLPPGAKPSLRKKRALTFSQRWAPYRTAATWLLWRSLDPVPVEY